MFVRSKHFPLGKNLPRQTVRLLITGLYVLTAEVTKKWFYARRAEV